MSLTQQVKNHHGIAAPLFSLHTQSSSGIGEYLDLIPLIDWCEKVGLDVIQLLPLNDTGPVISPYSPLSAFALNPIYISLKNLASEESLKPLKELTKEEQVPYEKILFLKEKILRECFERNFKAVRRTTDYSKFYTNNIWLNKYVRFKILKERYNWKPWMDWPKNDIEANSREIEYHTYVQYLCFSQMSSVKKYAEVKGVKINGDIPFLIARESADVWENPDYFLNNLSAGAPPDQFTAEGQNWNAPIYNWEGKFDENIDWWKFRLKVASNFYHLYRLDHVVGLFRIWAIPDGSSAIDGYYIPSEKEIWLAQGTKILKALLEASSMRPIAEDLGVVPDEVRKVLNELGIPGTKVMRWEEDPVEKYQPNSMTTVSTHDTETLLEWLKGEASYDVIRKILFKSHHSASQYHINLLHEYFSLIPGFSRGNGLSERLNVPGKVLESNWRYRYRPSVEEIKANADFEKIIKSFVVDFRVDYGSPKPMGPFLIENGVNFSFYANESSEVTLELYNFDDRAQIAEIHLDPKLNRTGKVWHIAVYDLPERICYAYRLKDHLILDPYAKAVNTSIEWGKEEKKYQPLGLVPPRTKFDWEGDTPLNLPMKDLVIYELHVRGMTQDSSSHVASPGTFLGIIEKIPYLKKLGINAVKLMPIQEFDECAYTGLNPDTKKRLYNYWGYSTVNFFSPMNRYASKPQFLSAVDEFKTLVKALHRNGIEVILDIVFNHTGEGFNDIYSFLGIDPAVYYLINKNSEMMNYSGCGNTLNCNHPIVRRLILTCLEYWVSEMHVDGFRFDLAAVFSRGTEGEHLVDSPLVEEISDYPILAKTKLIAEPWDMGGLYQLGSFYHHDKRWSEWNDKYRDSVRRFIRGDLKSKGEFATRICGSQDIYGSSQTPCSSINFVTAHDGFTLQDLVSYDNKHNIGNGEGDRDGNPSNLSWNCGVEGETSGSHILALRERQIRNFHLVLMISQGVPMLTMGNEYGHTRLGNNNGWCQDNRLSWFLWDQLEKQQGFFRFYKGMIEFRNQHPLLRMGRFLVSEDIDWHGEVPFHPDWENDEPFIAFSLKDHEEHLYVAFNATDREISVTLPKPLSSWRLMVNTGNPSPQDFYEEDNAPIVDSDTIAMISHSSILLISK